VIGAAVQIATDEIEEDPDTTRRALVLHCEWVVEIINFGLGFCSRSVIGLGIIPGPFAF